MSGEARRRLRHDLTDRLAADALAVRLRDALTGPAHAGQPAVVWEDRGSQVLLHVARLEVRTLENALVVAVEAETAELGSAPLIVRFVFGGAKDGAGLVAATDADVHGDALLAARWGPLFRSVIWAALARMAESHAAERGLQPRSISVHRDHVRFLAEPSRSLQALAFEHRERGPGATGPAGPAVQ